MVEDLDKTGRGRASGGAAQLNFNTALEAWRAASEDKKKDAALAVLANVGSRGRAWVPIGRDLL